MERHRKTYITAVQHFLSGGEGSGVWHLRKKSLLRNSTPGKTRIRHMKMFRDAAWTRRIYGYETSAAINDARKKFMNMPIEEVRNHKRIPERCISSKGCRNSEPYRCFMVWRGTDMLVPEFAFEVEYTKKIGNGAMILSIKKYIGKKVYVLKRK